MPFRELIIVECEHCKHELGPFGNHSAAIREAEAAGWNLAHGDYCPDCYVAVFNVDQEPELEELVPVELPKKISITMHGPGGYGDSPRGFPPGGGAAAAAVRAHAREEELVVRRQRLAQAAGRMMLGTTHGFDGGE